MANSMSGGATYTPMFIVKNSSGTYQLSTNPDATSGQTIPNDQTNPNPKVPSYTPVENIVNPNPNVPQYNKTSPYVIAAMATSVANLYKLTTSQCAVGKYASVNNPQDSSHGDVYYRKSTATDSSGWTLQTAYYSTSV